MMGEYGVTSSGFKVKTREQIVADMENAARGFFEKNVNLSAKSPLGLFIQLLAWPISLVWLALEGVYNSAYVDTATGQSLDNVGKYIGIGRRPATKAIHVVEFSGTENTTVPAGFIVDTGNKNPVEFEVMTEGKIGARGIIALKVLCRKTGSIGNVSLGMITKIKNPVNGINQINHRSLFSQGLDRETDFEFRERYKESVAKGGASTLESITAAILEVPNVIQAIVIENDTMTTDSDGRPPKSIEAVVLGGDDADIGQAIFTTKAAGIQPYGNVTTSVLDRSGRVHNVSFTRAQEVNVYVKIRVAKNAEFPLDGETRLKDQVISYIGGVDSKNIYNRGLLMGETVVYMQIPMAIDVPGIEDLVITIGTSPNPTGTTNLPMLSNQKARTGLDKVEVSYSG
ncbi:MAG TPA: baseplate J/gp47 family protein [Bacillota bacterium]|nr:baseplate J/gp47 family protein [Bacillota bacterium]